MPQRLPPTALSQVREQIYARGEVQLWFHRQGVWFPDKSPNRITNLGRARFPRLFGGDPEALAPSRIAIGSGASPASPEDQSLEAPGIGLPFAAPPAYSGASVTFQAELGQDQAIGLELREFGLMDAQDTLLARFVREETTVKTGDMGLILFWKIEF